MNADHLLTFATLFALVWMFGATLALLYPPTPRTWRSLVYAGASLLTLAAVVWIGSLASLGRNSLVFVCNALLSGSPQHLCAAGLGLAVGLGPAMWPWQGEWSRPAPGVFSNLRKVAGLLSILLCFFFTGLLLLQDQLKPYLLHRSFGSILANPMSYSTQPEFTLEEYHDCAFHPVRIAVGPDQCLYATGYTGEAMKSGIVVKLSESAELGAIVETTIATNLSRPHGLAFFGKDLYVSRSGQYHRAQHGKLMGIATGAVTLLRDLDDDGVMDYYHDVLADLPGAQGPDPLHQNNGIAFSPDGWLYTTVGAHSDRAPAVAQYEGTILRSRPDGSDLSVFARGFRNPFDVVIGPEGSVFCTDNDASDRNARDELNHVTEGAHYGFPYADGKTPHPKGTVSPIFVAPRGNLQGLAYTDCPALPETYRKCLYAVNHGNGEIHRFTLQRDGTTYRVVSTLFARVPGALDIAIDDNGTFYVSCFDTKKVYRLRYRWGAR